MSKPDPDLARAAAAVESFREWQRQEQAARHAVLYDKPIPLELAAKLDATLLELGIRPPKKGARV